MDKLKIYILIVFHTLGAIENKEICDFNNLDCIIRGTRHVYNTLLEGVNGFETIEPLALDNVSGKIPGLKYVLNNATLYPMKECELVFKLLNESHYDYNLECTRLVLSANVVAKGYLGLVKIDGSDLVTITANDYIISVKGQLSIKSDERDQSKHFILKKNFFYVDTEARGDITFKSKNMFGLTIAQADVAATYFKDNWKSLENTLRYPTITEFMQVLQFRKVGPYLRANPLDKIIPKEEINNTIKITTL